MAASTLAPEEQELMDQVLARQIQSSTKRSVRFATGKQEEEGRWGIKR
jgi:hypothetical protein